MTAMCPCVWSAMIYNLSPDTRTAVVEERVRTTHPVPGPWAEGHRWTMVLPPWGREYIGCRNNAVGGEGGEGGQCGAEHAWDIISCEVVEPRS